MTTPILIAAYDYERIELIARRRGLDWGKYRPYTRERLQVMEGIKILICKCAMLKKEDIKLIKLRHSQVEQVTCDEHS